MKYYALTINPLNVTKGTEEIQEALKEWCKKANMEPLYGTYELAGKKLHYHTVVKGDKEPYFKRCKVEGFQIYFGGAHGWKWDRYIFKEKNLEEEAIFQHYCQNNYLFDRPPPLGSAEETKRKQGGERASTPSTREMRNTEDARSRTTPMD